MGFPSWDDVADTVTDGAGNFGDFLVDTAKNGYEAATDVAEEAVDLAEAAYEEASDALEEVFDKVEDLAEEAVEPFADAWEKIEELGEDAWEAANDYVERSLAAVVDPLEEIYSRTASAAEEGWHACDEALEKAWQAAEDFVQDPVGKLTEAVDRVYDATTSMAIAAAEGMAKAIETALDVMERIVLFVGNLIESALELIARLGACLAGQTVFTLTKADLVFWNTGFALLGATVRPLSNEFQERLQTLFGSTTFDTVMYQELSHLPQEYWENDDTDAITMSGITVAGVPIDYMIYVRSFVSKFPDSMRLLVHELVHVTQYQRLKFEPAFACAYGVGFADARFDYRKNAMEDQAYAFVDKHYWDIDAWDLERSP
jgi:colicin import membrane protein